jgi:type IX secretion system PorP/SprF family membrane protein
MKIIKLACLLYIFTSNLLAQETLPIYSDYLSDNVYLVHPAAAGIGSCAKLRLTHRQQWVGNEDAPSLQTVSFHTRMPGDESKVGLGAIAFTDRNGFHSQFGAQGTFAYHLDMGGREFNQLSFAISAMYVQNKIDETNFLLPGEFDPIITNLIQSENYFNADFGLAYHYKTGFAYFTAKNLLLTSRSLEDRTFESLNIRRYLLSLGYFFDNDNVNKIKWEPSIMGQYIERTQEIFVDFNIKAYRKLAGNNTLWAALSYRSSFDGNEVQELTQITPII